MDEGGNTLLTNWMYIYSLLTNLYSHLLVHSLSLIHCLLLVSQSVLELVQASGRKNPCDTQFAQVIGDRTRRARSTLRSHSHNARSVFTIVFMWPSHVGTTRRNHIFNGWFIQFLCPITCLLSYYLLYHISSYICSPCKHISSLSLIQCQITISLS